MKSKTTAILLVFFLGGLGADKFYLNKPLQAVARILTIGGFFGIWPLIDLIRYIMMDDDRFQREAGN